MTIAVSVKVGEGLVLAADSTSSFFLDGVLAQSYHHARKLLQLEEYPVGILTYGLGSVGGRNLESLLAEFERTIRSHKTGDAYSVRGLAEQLFRFVLEKYERAYPPPPRAIQPEGDQPIADVDVRDQAEPPADEPVQVPAQDTRPVLGIVVGGFSRDDFFSDEFAMEIPHRQPIEVWPDSQEVQQYGVRWWGQTSPIERLYLGCDYRGFVEWCRSIGVAEDQIYSSYMELRERIMWPIIYEGMPLQDAIDLAVYLVNVTIGHSRFAVGPPVCGGDIDVATITPRGMQWISRKSWQVKADSVFF